MSEVYLTKVIENTALSDDVYSLTVQCPQIAAEAVAGQFVHIRCGEQSFLRRPLSICSVKDDTVRFVFDVKGEGTRWLAGRAASDTLDILGPLGRGFAYKDDLYRKIAVVGGGMGVAPMLYAAQSANYDVVAVLGFRDKSKIILVDEFNPICKDVVIATDDGSLGIPGTVAEPLERLLKIARFDAVLACGPFKMLKTVAALCDEHFVPCQVSMEERMACGVGACLVCACATLGIDDIKQMSRVCKDGPVFDAGVIDFGYDA